MIDQSQLDAFIQKIAHAGGSIRSQDCDPDTLRAAKDAGLVVTVGSIAFVGQYVQLTDKAKARFVH